MSTGLRLTKNPVNPRLQKMIENGSMKGARARIYPLYQKLQAQRFQTEGASEGMPWPALNPIYAARKVKEFSSYPGGGRKLLIATSTLAGAVIGPGSGMNGIDKHIAMFSEYSFSVSVKEGGTNAAGKKFDYPKYVAVNRPFMKFSDESIQKMKDEIRKFMVKGK